MRAERGLFKFILPVFLACAACAAVSAQQRSHRQRGEDAEFGPNVRAYLGNLRDEQEVVDDRVSRRDAARDRRPFNASAPNQHTLTRRERTERCPSAHFSTERVHRAARTPSASCSTRSENFRRAAKSSPNATSRSTACAAHSVARRKSSARTNSETRRRSRPSALWARACAASRPSSPNTHTASSLRTRSPRAREFFLKRRRSRDETDALVRCVGTRRREETADAGVTVCVSVVNELSMRTTSRNCLRVHR